MIQNQKFNYYDYGKIDWIYWVDLNKWDNVLVFGENKKRNYKDLDFFFKSVQFIDLNEKTTIEKLLNSNDILDNKYDLILCTDLLKKFCFNFDNYIYIMNWLIPKVNNNGKILFSYFHGHKLKKKFAKFILNLNYKKFFKGTTISFIKEVTEKTDVPRKSFKSKLKIDQILYVYPSYERPWTISNSLLFAKRIYDWKKKTKKNAFILSFISSKYFVWSLKYWWPSRIVIIGNKSEYNK